jgi:hypothetical protein
MVPGYQIAQRTQAALNPENPGGILGGLGKALMGLDSGGLQPAVQNVVNQRVGNQQNLASLLSQPDPFSALANARPGQYSPLSGGTLLAGATPENVADARLKAAQGALFGAKANYAQYLMSHPAGTAALGALGTGAGAGGSPPGMPPGGAPAGKASDPRGLIPYITQSAQLNNIDPATAIKVASNEGLGTPIGDGGTSGGAFQLHLTPGGKGGAVGDQFLADTGMNPLDPANEKATIDYAMHHVAQNGWGAFNGAKNAGIGEFEGVARPNTAGGAGAASPPAAGSITPAEAQRRADVASVLGETPPAYINEAAGLPFVGPKAEATARGETAGKPLILRQGASAWMQNPQTGHWSLEAQSPVLPSGTELVAGAGGGPPVAREVPGANQAIQNQAQATHTGQYRAELGGIPGVNIGGGPPPAAGQQPAQQPAVPGQPPGQPPAAAPPSQPANQPVTTPRGTKLPALSEQALPQSPEELKNDLPEWRKTTQEWTNAIVPARQAEMRLSTIAQAFKLTESGAYETNKAQLAALVKSLGINPAIVTQTNPAAVQEALHDNILTTLPLLKAATPRPSQTEFLVTSENREHPNIQPEANLRMLSEDLALVRQAQQLPLDWNDAFKSGWRNPDSFLAHWNGLNPLEDTRSQVEKEIGPLKGMPGFQAPGQSGAQSGKQNLDVTEEEYNKLPPNAAYTVPGDPKVMYKR